MHPENYYSDIKTSIKRQKSRLQREQPLVVVDAAELDKYVQKMQDNGKGNSIVENLQQDRLNRYNISRARSANWKNTIGGQRKQKLQEKDARLAAIEAERVKLDREFAEEEEQRRRTAIDRAKKLLYYETDMVKALHSRINQLQAIEERDMQMALKYARRNAGVAQNEQLQIVAKSINDREINREIQQQNDRKNKSLEIAREQLMQHHMKMERASNERKALIEEGQRVMKADREYNAKQAQIDATRKKESLALYQELQKLRQECKERATQEKLNAIEQDKEIEVWVTQKASQTQLKQDLEKRKFLEGIMMRQRMGENQQKINNDADARIEEQIKQRVIEKESKYRIQDEQNREKKKKFSQELKTFFLEYQQRAKQAKVCKQQEDAKILKEYIRIRDDAIQQKESQKTKKQAAEKAMQQQYLEQIANNQQKKLEEKQKIQEEAQKISKERETQELELLGYVKQIGQQEWAKKNYRLQTFIKEQTKKAPNSQRSLVNTSNRLGFTNNGYTMIDLAGSNEIVNGTYLSK